MEETKQWGIIEKVIIIALSISPLFIINWLHNTSFPIRAEYLLYFQSITMLFLALSQPNRWVMMFFVWTLISFYLFGFKGNFYLSIIFIGQLWLYILYQAVKSPEKILKAIAISSLIVIGSMIAQIIGVLPLTIGSFTIGIPMDAWGNTTNSLSLAYSGVSGLIGQPNITGAYLAICLPIFLVYYRWALGLVIVALVMTKCNGAMIAGMAGIAFYYLFTAKAKQTVLVISLVLILAVGFCFIDKPDYSSRLIIAKEVICKQMTGWSILTGHGLGSFSRAKINVSKSGNATSWMAQAHNEYIQVYFELGLIGLAIILGFIGSLIIRFTKTFIRTNTVMIISSSLVSLIILSSLSFNFHHALTAMVGLVFLSMADRCLIRNA